MKFVILSALLLVFIAPAGLSHESRLGGYETVLLPIAPHWDVPGAYGTLWRMELWVHNGSGRDIGTLQPTPCVGPCPPLVPAGSRTRYKLVAVNENGNGGLLYVGPDTAANVHFSARLMELTRGSQPTGVLLPVVRERDFLTGPSELLGIPSGKGVRSALRVYDPHLHRGSAVEVEVLDSGGMVLGTKVLFPGNHPSVPADPLPGVFYNRPGFDAIFDLEAEFPAISQVERYHIRLKPLAADQLYWGMVSVTHNDTQHVLLIVPQ